MAAERLSVYKCEKCGNMVEVVYSSEGTLTCCNQPMTLLTENTVDAAREKHVPVAEQSGTKVTVKVGNVAHPMEEKHYIEWIEVIAGGKAYREFLSPGQAPEATFVVDGGDIAVRAYCNLHGLWRS